MREILLGFRTDDVFPDPVDSTLLRRIWKSEQSGPSPMVGSGTALDDLHFLLIE